MDVRVRVSSVDVAFTERAGRQLAALERPALEVQRRHRTAWSPRTVTHEQRLREIPFVERTARRRWIGTRRHWNGLNHQRRFLRTNGVARQHERRYSDKMTETHPP